MKNSIKVIWKSWATLCILGLLAFGVGHSQRYGDRQGVVAFEASEALFEPVRAKNEAVSVLFDLSNRTLAALALIRGFSFDNALMQEHFNENYIESDRYPKAIFKGTILDFDPEGLSSGPREYTLRGSLEVRGKLRQIGPRVTIQKTGDILWLRGNFMVLPQDFDIAIPGIVANKIAKEVLVTFEFKLKEDERP